MKDLPQYMKDNTVKNESCNVKLGEKSLTEFVEGYEKALIKLALSETNNFTEAAELLKISKQALNYKMNKYGL